MFCQRGMAAEGPGLARPSAARRHLMRSPPLAGWLDSIYNGWEQGGQFWFFTLYDNDEMADLTTEQCATLKHLLTTELKERS